MPWQLTADERTRLALNPNEEPIDVVIWDRWILTHNTQAFAGGTNILKLFSRVSGQPGVTDWMTNMTRANQLPEGWLAIFKKMTFRVFHDTNHVFGTTDMVGGASVLGDIQQLQNGGLFAFKSGTDKDYPSIPSSAVPSGPAMTGMLTGVPAAANSFGGWAANGTPHVNNYFNPNLQVAPANKQFNVNLDYSHLAAFTVNALTDMVVECIMIGPGKREVH